MARNGDYLIWITNITARKIPKMIFQMKPIGAAIMLEYVETLDVRD